MYTRVALLDTTLAHMATVDLMTLPYCCTGKENAPFAYQSLTDKWGVQK